MKALEEKRQIELKKEVVELKANTHKDNKEAVHWENVYNRV